MSAFKASGYITQSSDGDTLTYHDDSPYDANDEGLVLADFVSRIVQVKDTNDALLGTLNLGATDLTADFAITKDGVYRFIPILTTDADPAVIYTTEIDYLSTQFYALKQRMYALLIKCDACCLSKASGYANDALEMVYSAGNNVMVGDLISAQSDIDAANALINASLK